MIYTYIIYYDIEFENVVSFFFTYILHAAIYNNNTIILYAVKSSPRTLQRGRCLGERLAAAMLSRSPMRCGARVGFVHHHPTKRAENKGFRGEPPPRVVVVTAAAVTVLYNMVVVSHIIICIYTLANARADTMV